MLEKLPLQDRIKQLYLQLAFNAKALVYFENGHVNKSEFDVETNFPDDNMFFPKGMFESDKTLNDAAMNNIMISFGTFMISLSFKLKELGKVQHFTGPERDFMRLVHLIRCCFGHDMIKPVWDIHKPEEERIFAITTKDKTLTFDLSEVNKTNFDLKQIHGYQGFMVIYDKARELANSYPD